MLAVNSMSKFYESVTEYEYLTHTPFTSTTFIPNDEVRISIQQQDGFTYPCENYLQVSGKVSKLDGLTEDATI